MKKEDLNEFHFIKGLTSLKEIKKYNTFNEFVDVLNRGDVLIVQLKRPQILDKKIKKLLMNIGQRSTITSSKVYLGNKKLIGYGVKKYLERGSTLDISDIDSFSKNYSKIIALRPKNLSKEQEDKFIKFLKVRKGLDYNTSSMYNTVWKRILDNFKKKNNMEIDENIVKDLKHTYICSNIISVALRNAGWDGDFNNSNVMNVWPIDFLLSDDFEKIGKYYIK